MDCTAKKERRFKDCKIVPIQYRITDKQMEMLKTVAVKHGTRTNDMARLLMLSVLTKFEFEKGEDNGNENCGSAGC